MDPIVLRSILFDGCVDVYLKMIKKYKTNSINVKSIMIFDPQIIPRTPGTG